MRRVAVRVEPAYEVLVGSGATSALAEGVSEADVAVVTDSHVAPLHAEGLVRRLSRPGRRVELLTVPAGEDSKSLATYASLQSRLATAEFGRDSAVVSLGGGMASDLAGFLAATYLRGVAFYACPTSLLAMVDASVGGKTGVNLPEGKNLVGAFWQPRLVAADVSTLATLPVSQFREGAVELFKAGLLGDPSLLGALSDPNFAPSGSDEVLADYISRAVAVKAAVVAADEREGGSRAQLNLGHTLGHALEAATSHALSHGEAVAYGLLFSALLGRERGLYDYTAEAASLLDWLGPTPLPAREFDELLPYMRRDKKNLGKRQRFVLLAELGKPVVVADVDVDEQKRAWRLLLEATS